MPLMRQISLFDMETGELISSHQNVAGSRLKEGWIVVYKEALKDLIMKAPNYATMKVYLYIATSQDYDTVTYISTSFVARKLGMAYQTAWNAVKWLIENNYLRRSEVNGSIGFIVNPLVSTCGRKNYEEKLAAFADSFSTENADVKGLLPEPFEDDDDSVPEGATVTKLDLS